MTFDGKKWSTPEAIPDPQNGYSSIACPSAEFCMVVALNGAALTWANGHWSSPNEVIHDGYSATSSVSCASNRFCVMVNAKGSTATYR